LSYTKSHFDSKRGSAPPPCTLGSAVLHTFFFGLRPPQPSSAPIGYLIRAVFQEKLMHTCWACYEQDFRGSRKKQKLYMHSATVESYLLICSAIEQEKFSTRKFDTCQTKRCCCRVRIFRKKRSEQGLTKAFLYVRCSNLKGESRMGCL
jgi:hypothetical protein